MGISVKDSLPFDLVPGRDWHLFCRAFLTARISMLYSDLETIQHSLTLHTLPHHDMDLIQCRQHLVTGAGADHISMSTRLRDSPAML
jgi:hypothetical protein